MDLLEPTRQAFALLLSGDRALWQSIWLSLWVSVAAIALVAAPSIALGFLLAKKRFPGQRAAVVLVQALLSFPTVVIGLVIYLLLSRRGPFGSFELLFTPWAIMFGYMVIAFPILVVFTVSAVQGADPRVYETARCLGAGKRAIFWHVVIPAALPSITAGLAIGMGVAWFSLLAGEIISGQYGIGYFTWEAYSLVQYPHIIIGMVAIGGLGLGCTALVKLATRPFLRWQPKGR